MSHTYQIDRASVSDYEIVGIPSLGDESVKPWYSASWLYRYRITINHEFISEDLTDFPLVLRLDSLALEGSREDRYDLVVTSGDGTTKLSHEREDRNTVWVKVPNVSATEDTVLYLYYGNNSASDQQRIADVWTNGFLGVWHMDDDPGVQVTNSVRDVYHATTSLYGDSGNGRKESSLVDRSSLEAGRIGQGLRFSGTNAHLNIGRVPELLGQEALTVSAWGKPTERKRHAIMEWYDGVSSSDDMLWFEFSSSGGVEFRLRSQDGTAWSTSNSATDPYEAEDWVYATGVFNGSTVTAFKNALAGNAATKTDKTRATVVRQLFFGEINENHNVLPMKGVLDELRIATIARSVAWIRAEYTNQCNCEDFLTISDTVETSPTATTKTGESTITLKPDRPLSFSSLAAFVPNASDSVTYQLSSDGGTTWLFYTKDGWRGANPSNPHHRSSANDINGHLDSFPTGDGTLLWRAYLPSGTSLDSIQIDYIPGSSSAAAPIPADGTAASPATSLQDFRIQSLNTLFRSAFHRTPTAAEWTHWVTRMLTEGKPLDAWLGAMEWATLFTS